MTSKTVIEALKLIIEKQLDVVNNEPDQGRYVRDWHKGWYSGYRQGVVRTTNEIKEKFDRFLAKINLNDVSPQNCNSLYYVKYCTNPTPRTDMHSYTILRFLVIAETAEQAESIVAEAIDDSFENKIKRHLEIDFLGFSVEDVGIVRRVYF